MNKLFPFGGKIILLNSKGISKFNGFILKMLATNIFTISTILMDNRLLNPKIVIHLIQKLLNKCWPYFRKDL